MKGRIELLQSKKERASQRSKRKTEERERFREAKAERVKREDNWQKVVEKDHYPD